MNNIKKTIYFDHCAGSPLNPLVEKEMISNLSMFGNPMRTHKIGMQVRYKIEQSRKKIATYFDANPNNVIFTSSGAESNNTVIKSFKQNEILISAIEHNSIFEAFNLKKFKNIIKVDKNAMIDLNNLDDILQKNSQIKLVSIMGANNVVGTIQPIYEISKICKKHDVLFHSDIAQLLGKSDSINQLINYVDFLTISGHKIGAPSGIGVIIVSDNGKNNLLPLISGGGAEFGIRSGSYASLNIIGIGCAIENLNVYQWQSISKLRDKLENELEKLCSNVRVIDVDTPRVSNISSLKMPGVDVSTQLIHFDLDNFCIGSGSAACSSGVNKVSHVLKAIGENDNDIIRVSFGPQNNLEEVNLFIKSWHFLYKNS